MANLVAHDVRRRRRTRAHDDLALAVGAGADVPGRPARRQRDAAERTHVVEIGYSAGADVDRVDADEEPFLDELRQLSESVYGLDDLGRKFCPRCPVAMQDGFQMTAVPVAGLYPVAPGPLEPRHR